MKEETPLHLLSFQLGVVKNKEAKLIYVKSQNQVAYIYEAAKF